MAYFHICPQCGSHLDPGESCDCKNDTERRPQPFSIERARDSPTARIHYTTIKEPNKRSRS